MDNKGGVINITESEFDLFCIEHTEELIKSGMYNTSVSEALATFMEAFKDAFVTED